MHDRLLHKFARKEIRGKQCFSVLGTDHVWVPIDDREGQKQKKLERKREKRGRLFGPMGGRQRRFREIDIRDTREGRERGKRAAAEKAGRCKKLQSPDTDERKGD